MKSSTVSPQGKTLLLPIVLIVILGAVLFLPAGTFDYWEAWTLWVGFSILTAFITVYFSKTDPQLLLRRVRLKQNETPKKPPAILNLWFLCFIVPGLDFRFHWSTVPVWLIIIANALFVVGYILIIFVFKENSYASTTIQVEAEQPVVSTGPFAVVRHPMYLGIMVMILFAPLALGSFWGLLPALLCVPLNVYRILGEEEVLLKDLPGYREYCQKTRYRLVPYIW